MRARKDNLVKPASFATDEAWRDSLLSEKQMILTQMRREIHTRGNTCQRYLDRIDRALAKMLNH